MSVVFIGPAEHSARRRTIYWQRSDIAPHDRTVALAYPAPAKTLTDTSHDGRRRRRSPLPFYSKNKLTTAGGNSVLPPWVRYRFPEVDEMLRVLREQPCDLVTCEYCAATHNPKGRLQSFFGFGDFRPEPRDELGGSLQHAIVRHAMADQSLLGILPTGGGKSLCYQLPALARYQRRGMLTIVIFPNGDMIFGPIICTRPGSSRNSRQNINRKFHRYSASQPRPSRR